MALTVTMPQLGESVTEGTIARWLKQPGDAVAKYESIAEVITDKVNAEIPAPADGVMSELIAPEGTVVPVGQPICSIETGVASAEAAAEPEAQETAAVAAPAAQSAQATPGEPQAAPVEPQAGGETAVAPIQDAFTDSSVAEAPASDGASSGNGQAGGYHVTPAVRMLVREHGVDLSQITGSGIGGRISKKDVLEYVQRRDAAGGASVPDRAPAGVGGGGAPPPG
jgi:pyruvate/2-oxoglutarate dehydrogenase complex dihydrolipoamide acyltransferase (E2) component